jgi:hypothetical protein
VLDINIHLRRLSIFIDDLCEQLNREMWIELVTHMRTDLPYEEWKEQIVHGG